MLSRRESELQDLRNSPIYIAKNEKACSEENINGVDRLSLNKEFLGLYEQKYCPLNGRGWRWEDMKENC